jgi:hypothetical protein
MSFELCDEPADFSPEDFDLLAVLIVVAGHAGLRLRR